MGSQILKPTFDIKFYQLGNYTTAPGDFSNWTVILIWLHCALQQTQHEHMSDARRTLIEVIFQCTTTIQSISWSFWSLVSSFFFLFFYHKFLLKASSWLVFYGPWFTITTCTTLLAQYSKFWKKCNFGKSHCN